MHAITAAWKLLYFVGFPEKIYVLRGIVADFETLV